MIVKISFPKKITWKVLLQNCQDPFAIFGKNVRKKLKSDLVRLEASHYHYVLEDVNSEYIQRFTPIYEMNISTKPNAIVYDIQDKIILHPRHKFAYKALSLYHKDLFLGGLIFSIRQDHIVGAFRVFPNKLESLSLKNSPSLLCDYYLYKYAIQNGMKYIRRGKDRNCYGLGASIGLAVYKIKAGNLAYTLSEDIDEGFENQFDWDGKQTVLIFEAEKEYDTQIRKIRLLVSGDSTDIENIKEKYPLLFDKTKFQTDLTTI